MKASDVRDILWVMASVLDDIVTQGISVYRFRIELVQDRTRNDEFRVTISIDGDNLNDFEFGVFKKLCDMREDSSFGYDKDTDRMEATLW